MSNSLRALIIDDSEDDAFFVQRALKRGGYTVESTRVDTAEGMTSALDRGAWDVVLSDYEMPDFTMLSALALRNERLPDVPFIIVSGRIGEDAIVAAMKGGAQEYVLKSDLTRLVPALERAQREMEAHAEKRRAEVALRVSEERYALAVRGSSDGLWDWNITTGEIYFAPRFKEILGFEEHELEGVLESFTCRIHPDDVAALNAALDAHLSQRVPFRVECRARTKQEEERWVLFRGQALWNDRGQPVRMAGSLTDLTERKRAEEELREKLQIIQHQFALIQKQREEISLLMTPIIQVWDGVLMTPVLGTVDSNQAARLMETLLEAVVKTRSRCTILDLTAVEAIDATTANHVVRLIRAVELVGATGIVVGIQPRVATAIVSAGMDLAGVKTLANLRDALLFCMDRRPRQPR